MTAREIARMAAERITEIADPVYIGPFHDVARDNEAKPRHREAKDVQTQPVANAAAIVHYLHAVENVPRGVEDVMYEPEELPEGLIDLPNTAKKFGIPVRALGSWVHIGKLPGRPPGGPRRGKRIFRDRSHCNRILSR